MKKNKKLKIGENQVSIKWINLDRNNIILEKFRLYFLFFFKDSQMRLPLNSNAMR